MTLGADQGRTHFQLLTDLERESGRRIELHLNRNRVNYVGFEEIVPGGRVRVRLQRAFLSAPEEVVLSLARWIRYCRGRCPSAVAGFINSHAGGDARPPRPTRTRTRGRYHDLAELAEEVSRVYFGGQLRPAITWGRAVRTRRGVRQRQLGTFDAARDLVTVSPVLDDERVPRFFVAFVVFHEMLHAVHPGEPGRDHDRRFRAAERRHPDYRRAAQWQRRNIGMLTNPERARGGRRRSSASRRKAERTIQGVLF